MAIDLKLIDKLLADYKNPEDIIGENGLLEQLTQALLERAMHGQSRFQPAAQSPTNHAARVRVQYHGQIHKLGAQPDVSNVGPPQLIHADRRDRASQVWM